MQKAMTKPALKWGDAKQFLELIGTSPTEEQHFLLLPDKGKGAFPLNRLQDLEDAWGIIRAQNLEGDSGAFVAIQEMAGLDRKEKNFLRCRALFIDIDKPGRTLQDCVGMTILGVPPTAVVETSPDHFHVYWRAMKTEAANDGLKVKACLKALAERFDGDPKCTDLARVMRLPGTFHQKKDPFLVVVRHVNEEAEVDIGEVFDAAKFSGMLEPAKDEAREQDLEGRLSVAYDEIAALSPAISGMHGHASTFRVACTLAAMSDLDHEKRMVVLQKWNRERTGGKHWTVRELEHKLLDAETKVGNGGWEYRDVVVPEEGGHRPFPVEALPPPLYDYAMAVTEFCGVDIAVTATVALSACATMIGRQARVQERKGLFHYPALFTCIIAGTGERKSPVFKSMLAPVDRIVGEWQCKWKETLAGVKAKATARKALIRGYERQAQNGKMTPQELVEAIRQAGPEPVEPPSPRLYTNDATEERLVQLLSRCGEFAVLSGEARPVFNQILGRYAGGGMTGESVYLAAISGDTITRDRVSSGEEIVIEHPCLNVCLMVQPDKFTELVNNVSLRDSGALARIAALWPTPRVGTRFEDDLNHTVKPHISAAFERALRGLRAKKIDADVVVALSEEAQEARRNYHNEIERRLGQIRDFIDAPDVLAKSCSFAARVALVLALVEREAITGEDISAATWAKATLLSDWYIDATCQVRRLLQDGVSMAHAARAQRWLVKTQRTHLMPLDLVTRGPMPRPDRLQAAATMRVLEEHGIVMSTGRTSGAMWVVNPKLHRDKGEDNVNEGTD